MSLTLWQIQSTRQRIDFSGLLPSELCLRTADEVAAIPLWQGRSQVRLDTLFHIETNTDGLLHLHLFTLDDKLDAVGQGMREGCIFVHGDVGQYAGRGMLGGELSIDGNAGDFCGSGLRAGRLVVNHDVGDYLGAPALGELRGQQGGLLLVRGNAGARAAERQRRGICLIEGDCAELAAHRMIAGTLYIGGRTGPLCGHGMRRGTVLLGQSPDHLDANFRSNGCQQLGFLNLLLNELNAQSATLDRLHNTAPLSRYLGDVAAGGCGEIFILS